MTSAPISSSGSSSSESSSSESSSPESSSPESKKQEQPSLSQFEQRLGYRFADRGLLDRALTHKSHAAANNERLEFLGDAVLGYLIGTELYRRFGNMREDSLSLMRSGLVRGEVLADVAREIGLSANLRLGSGELKSGGRGRDSILADAFEAVIGAVHEDGGIEACRDVTRHLFASRIEALDVDDLKDAKTRLQEVLQGAQLELPRYTVEDVSGADHARRYEVRCLVRELDLSESAQATSRRQAEKDAASKVLELIEAGKLV
jgi:ribonuclease-3